MQTILFARANAANGISSPNCRISCHDGAHLSVPGSHERRDTFPLLCFQIFVLRFACITPGKLVPVGFILLFLYDRHHWVNGHASVGPLAASVVLDLLWRCMRMGENLWFLSIPFLSLGFQTAKPLSVLNFVPHWLVIYRYTLENEVGFPRTTQYFNEMPEKHLSEE